MWYLTDAIGLLLVPKLVQKFKSKKLFVASGVFAILSGVQSGQEENQRDRTG
jgi:hydrogenase/urease accessory protein HupE